MRDVMQAIKFDVSPETKAKREARSAEIDKLLEESRTAQEQLRDQREAAYSELRQADHAGDDVWAEDTRSRIRELSTKGDALTREHSKLWYEQRRLHTPEQTQFYQDAAGRDRAEGRKKPYFAQDCELFARAFECWVEDQLAERKARSSYLVDQTRADRTSGLYPRTDDPTRAAMGKAMGAFVAALREAEQFRKAMAQQSAAAWFKSLMGGPRLGI
jgi:hypothetical protein